MAKSLTNDGTLNVGDATTGGLYAQLGMSAAYTLTNDGTLNTVVGSGGVRYLRSNLTNDGTVNIDSAEDAVRRRRRGDHHSPTTAPSPSPRAARTC